MKKIGHVDGATSDPVWRTHSLGMLAPHDLFIPNPGERENIDAEAFEHVGWVNPGQDGGVICGNHATAGDNSRPAYVRRVQIGGPVSQDVISTRTVTSLGPDDPMDVRRSEFDALSKRIDEIDVRLNRHALLLPKPDEPPSVQAEPPMSFYDCAFIAAYIDLRSADYDDITRIQRAHAIAAKLTRNRAVPA